MSQGLYVLLVNFFDRGPIISQIAQRRLGSYVSHAKLTRTFRPAFSNFHTGSKSPKFGLNFRPQSYLKGFGFEMEQYIGNLKHMHRECGWLLQIWHGNFADPSRNFYRGGDQKVQNLAFEVLWFRKEATYARPPATDRATVVRLCKTCVRPSYARPCSKTCLRLILIVRLSTTTTTCCTIYLRSSAIWLLDWSYVGRNLVARPVWPRPYYILTFWKVEQAN